jgi:hypothetical protein
MKEREIPQREQRQQVLLLSVTTLEHQQIQISETSTDRYIAQVGRKDRSYRRRNNYKRCLLIILLNLNKES